jgi:hypothetical protein
MGLRLKIYIALNVLFFVWVSYRSYTFFAEEAYGWMFVYLFLIFLTIFELVLMNKQLKKLNRESKEIR